MYEIATQEQCSCKVQRG